MKLDIISHFTCGFLSRLDLLVLKRTKKKNPWLSRRFTYHLKHCWGLWWTVENYGQTRLELCMLPLQASWLIFHSFLPKMLTHQLRVPGKGLCSQQSQGCRDNPCQPRREIRQMKSWNSLRGAALVRSERGGAIPWLSFIVRRTDKGACNPTTPPRLFHWKD